MTRTRNVGAFVRARRPDWERLAGLSERAETGRLPLADVEALDRLYRRAAGDLAFVRGAFPGSEAEGYLAQITARAYGALYRPRRSGPSVLVRLLVEDAPRTFRKRLGAFGLAASFLASGLLGGALAVSLDPATAGLLVPEPVRDAVAAGRLWTDGLLDAAPGISGSRLAHNNVSVAALAFALGLTAGLGTALLLVANGLLLGAVLAHAGQAGMGGALLGFVAAHGPLELTALLLAAQAGFVLASGIVDPGEWPRGTALRARGREAARLMAVVVPALALAALVEGAISPGARFAGPVKGALGLGLAVALFAFLAGAGRDRRAGEGAGE